MKALLRIFRYARNLWPYYLAISLFSILYALTNQVMPFIVKGAADIVVGAVNGQSPDYLLGLLLTSSFFGADALGTLFSDIGGHFGDVMVTKLRKQLSERYLERLLALPQRYYDQELSGTISNRLSRTITEVTNFIHYFCNNFFQMLLSIVFTLIVVAFYSWEVALLLLAIYPIFIWLTALTSRGWQAYQQQKNYHFDVASGRFAEVIGHIRVVKSFAQENQELRRLQHHYQQTIDINDKQSRQWHQWDALRRLVLNAIFCLIIGFIFWQTLRGRFTIGEMLLLIQFAMLVRLPLFSMSFIVDETQKAIAGSKDYFSVMSLKPAHGDRPHAKPLRVTEGSVAYRSVSFAYDTGTPLLSDISFTMQPGTKTALVGESGQGKTTLTSLLLRFYEPTGGEICIDGKNILDATRQSVREQIAVVFQEPALFSGTIRENIAYARPDATLRAVTEAATAAHAHDFIMKLPQGYDTQIGERGVRLSGGQKQRIAIARALLKDAPILILDEATSSLDSKAEAQVQAALERLMQGRTTLIIAHRLSTIAHVDKIVTLKDGRVDEIGSPHKLARTKGTYAELLRLQKGHSESARKKLKQFDVVGGD